MRQKTTKTYHAFVLLVCFVTTTLAHSPRNAPTAQFAPAFARGVFSNLSLPVHTRACIRARRQMDHMEQQPNGIHAHLRFQKHTRAHTHAHARQLTHHKHAHASARVNSHARGQNAGNNAHTHTHAHHTRIRARIHMQMQTYNSCCCCLLL